MFLNGVLSSFLILRLCSWGVGLVHLPLRLTLLMVSSLTLVCVWGVPQPIGGKGLVFFLLSFLFPRCFFVFCLQNKIRQNTKKKKRQPKNIQPLPPIGWRTFYTLTKDILETLHQNSRHQGEMDQTYYPKNRDTRSKNELRTLSKNIQIRLLLNRLTVS